MKKIFYLVIVLLCIGPGLYAYNVQHNTRRNRKKNQRPDSYCTQCCSEGRFVSSECCKQCNGCQKYNDYGSAECSDYPT